VSFWFIYAVNTIHREAWYIDVSLNKSG